MKRAAVTGLIGAVVLGAGASTAASALRVVTVPNVVGMRLDLATRTLHARGLRVNEECNGLLGCVVKRNWEACTQHPRAGRKLRRSAVVLVYAERPGNC
jgi:hypothetical protein